MSNKKMFVINATDVTQDVAEKQLINKFIVQYHIDKNGNILKASEAFYRISGFSLSELAYSPYTNLLHSSNNSTLLDDFYAHFKEQLAQAEKTMRRNEQVVINEIKCKACGRPMKLRTARTGVFLGCSGYELKGDKRCKETINLIPGEESEAITEDNDEAEAQELVAKRRCPICSAAMDSMEIIRMDERIISGSGKEEKAGKS